VDDKEGDSLCESVAYLNFKHGPLVGSYVADLVTGRPVDADARRLFELVSHPPQPG